MSFSPEVFKKKLDALQETQDSIVSISQWVLFHHRHATDICELWAEYTLTSDDAKTLKKKLSLLYLCNDIVQQARHKRKPEFSAGFALKLPLVIYLLYGTVDDHIKSKIVRLISVWSQRSVFTKPQIDAMNRAVRFLKEGREFSDDIDPLEITSRTDQGPQIAPDLVHLNQVYTHMTTLLDTSVANMAQVGQQAKLYLPEDHSMLDNLPLPGVYISKLNVLEKLCNMTVNNLQETKKTRQDVLAVLAQLTALVLEQEPADDPKIDLLQKKLGRILATREELLEMIDEPHPADGTPQQQQEEEGEEEPSPVFESASDSVLASSANENVVPAYEDSSDESDSERPQARRTDDDTPPPPPPPPPTIPRKRSLSESSTTSGGSKKSVAFSEEIEVKEFERDEQHDYIDVIAGGRSGENGNKDDSDIEDDDEDEGGDEDGHVNGFQEIYTTPEGFEAHHKDAVELMHERRAEAEHDDTNGTNGPDPELAKSGLLSLLSKLS